MAPAEAAAPQPSDAPAAVATAKRVAKKLKKGGQPAKSKSSDDGDESASSSLLATVDHPYVSFLHKRIRLYKKKMEKIRALEAVVAADGKVLNEQQRELVASKAAMEKIVAEFESLRDQFVDVYLQEEAAKKAAAEQEKLAAEAAAAEAEAAKVENDAAAVVDAKTEAETPAEQSAAPEVEYVDEATATEATGDAFAHVQDLLKTLHVVNLHQALGKEIPMVLDFFSKVLLGNTRPVAEVSFEENLAESLAEAKKYLERSDKVMACDSTYRNLREIVDSLAQMDVLAEVVEPAAAEEPADKLPEINFFTDSLLDSEDAVDETSKTTNNSALLDASTDDKADERANAPEEIEESIEAEAEDEEVVAPAAEVVARDLAPPPSSIPAPPMSFAAAAASTPANAPVSAWGKAVAPTSNTSSNTSSSSADAPDASSQRRPRPQGGRGGKSGGDGGFKGDGDKARRPRPQRSTDESFAPRSNSGSSASHSSRPSGPKEDRRPRMDRALRKPNSATTIHQPPHAHASPQA